MARHTVKSLVPENTDTERLYELLNDPNAAVHLFKLLAAGKGTQDDFIIMLDRIINSRRSATGDTPR